MHKYQNMSGCWMHAMVLADKGYHTGEELEQCQGNDITKYVSPKAPATKDIGLYPNADFKYDPDEDLYICPLYWLQFDQVYLNIRNGRTHQSTEEVLFIHYYPHKMAYFKSI